MIESSAGKAKRSPFLILKYITKKFNIFMPKVKFLALMMLHPNLSFYKQYH
jgi:hypothetical protein